MDEEEEAEEALRIIEEVLADPSTNPRKRKATAVASTIASTNRPGLGQSVSVVVDEGSEVRHVSKRAKARASSKGKEGAADPKSSKKRPAPGAGASTSKAAKKNKTSAAASQVKLYVVKGIPT